MSGLNLCWFIHRNRTFSDLMLTLLVTKGKLWIKYITVPIFCMTDANAQLKIIHILWLVKDPYKSLDIFFLLSHKIQNINELV